MCDTKVTHVTLLAESTRRYGAAANINMIPEIVVDMVKEEVNLGGNGWSTLYIVTGCYSGKNEIIMTQVDDEECCEFRMDLWACRDAANPPDAIRA